MAIIKEGKQSIATRIFGASCIFRPERHIEQLRNGIRFPSRVYNTSYLFTVEHVAIAWQSS